MQSGFTWARRKAGDLPGDEGGSDERWTHVGYREVPGTPFMQQDVYRVDIRIGVLKRHVLYTQAEYLSALKCVPKDRTSI